VFFNGSMNAGPVQTTVGEVVEMENNLIFFVFSFQIVCIPNSEFVIVQPSRHFLRNSNMEAVSFFQIGIEDTLVTTVLLRMLCSDVM
jgi:hypothetical protein